MLWNDAVERVEALPVRSSGRGGVSGTVFFDENGNGLVTFEEFSTRMGMLFDMLDTDGDGAVNWAEAEITAPRDLFDQADSDGNGVGDACEQ